MLSCNDKISLRQLKILLILDLFSTTSLILPRVAAESAGRDAWICIIIGTIIASIYVLIITHLTKKFSKETFMEYSERVLGRFLSIILGLVFILKLIISAAFGVRLFSELIKETLLQDTPIEIIILSMLLIISYAARKGFECRARIGEILIFIVFIPIILILFFALPEVKISKLMPIMVANPKDILSGGFFISLTYSSLEFLLIATSFTNKPNRIKYSSLFSLIFVGIFNCFLVFITLGIFGEVGTQRQIWPVMTIMQVVKLPGGLIERQDALMISFWILSMFAVLNAYVFYISVLTQGIFKLKEQNFLVLPFLPVIYLVALIPDNIVQAYDYMKYIMNYSGLLFLVAVPLLIIIISKIRKEGDPIEVD